MLVYKGDGRRRTEDRRQKTEDPKSQVLSPKSGNKTNLNGEYEESTHRHTEF